MIFGGVYVRDARAELPGSGYEARDLGVVELVVIHHVGGGVNRDYTAAEIAAYHVLRKGWPGIGYHFLIHPDGRIEYVGDVATVRYHVGLLNRLCVGVCLAGDFSEELPADRQLMRARMLVGGIRRRIGRPVEVVGHGNLGLGATGYVRSECPGRTWGQWAKRVQV